jgi:hypothetical protein
MRNHFCVPLFLAACISASSDVPLEQDFELRPGQTVSIAGTGQTVTFEAVAEDSRCPSNVVCVWAGNARVSLRLSEAGRDTSVALNTGLEPHSVGFGKIRFELKSVTPTPRAGTKTAADSYRVTLRATGA